MSRVLVGAVVAFTLIAIAGFVTLIYPVIDRDPLARASLEMDEAEGRAWLDSRIVIEVRGRLSKREVRESLNIQPHVSIGEDDLAVEHIAKLPWHEGFPWAKTRITINPQRSRLFNPETSYTLALRDEVLTFETITLPRVVDARVDSESDNDFSNEFSSVPTSSPIVFVFNEEVVWQHQYLRVEPSAQVTTFSEISSGGGTEVWVAPKQRWENSTAYTLTLREGIPDVFGHEGVEEFSLDFTTWPQPTVLKATPDGNDLPPDSAVRIEFERPVDRQTVEEAFRVEPSVSGSFEWETDRVLTWTPSEFQYSTTYTVSVGGESRGGDPIAAAEWSFTTRSQPKVVKAQPAGKSLRLDSSVRIGFEREVDRNSVENAFHIEPAVAGTFDWENDLVVTWMPSRLEYSTTYALSAGGESIDGDPVIPHEWAFSTQDPPVFVEIAGSDKSPTLLRAVTSGGIGEYSHQWISGDTSDEVSVDLWYGEIRAFEVTVTSGDQTATAELLVSGPPSPCPEGWEVITPDVCYTEESLPGPVQVFLARVDLQDSDLQLRAAPAADYLGHLGSVADSAQARNTLVSINGDFFSLGAGGYFTVGPIVSGGNFIYYPKSAWSVFALDHDLQPWVGRGEDLNIYLEPSSGERRWLQTINSAPVGNGLALFNGYWGEQLSLGVDGCYGLFAPADQAPTTAYQFSCGAIENVPLSVGEFVLVGTGAAAEWMEKNIEYPLTFETSPATESLEFMLGGSDILLQGGEPVEINSIVGGKHPRTAIGVDEEGFVYFVVADGRSTASVGMTLEELQRYLSEIGLVDAINLDGGGSTTMVLQESVMNTPSDGSERSVAAVVEITSGDTSCGHQFVRC